MELIKQAEQNVEAQEKLHELEAFRDSLTKLTSYGDSLQTVTQDLEARIENLRRRCGLDLPPCWAVRSGTKKGRPEYIYSVVIHENYLQVLREWPDHRDVQAKRIPGAVDLIADSLTVEQFGEMATPIREWSNQNRCRHFVKIYDKAKTKESFKRKLLLIEYFFYKFIDE